MKKQKKQINKPKYIKKHRSYEEKRNRTTNELLLELGDNPKDIKSQKNISVMRLCKYCELWGFSIVEISPKLCKRVLDEVLIYKVLQDGLQGRYK